jgi:hypothetical protein
MIHEIKEFFSKLLARPELEALDRDQVAEIAHDMGVTTDDLYRLDRAGTQTPPMPDRLRLEGLNPTVIQAEWPSVWKDLQRVCTLCESKDVCRNELELAPEALDWKRYCPNEHTIKSLHASRADGQ